MTIKTKLIVGTAELNKAIDSIVSRGKKLDQSIQVAGLSILAHIQAHGDVTLLNRLVVEFPKGSRRTAFMHWAAAFGKVLPNPDTETAKERPFLFDKQGNTDLEGAEERPWVEFKPEAPINQVFDFAQALAALIKKATREGVELKEGQAELLAQARALTIGASKEEATNA